MSIDSSIAGVHFPLQTDPGDIAYKTLAVNLSDLAAMGASPRFYLLALILPEVEPAWLEAFAKSQAALAETYGMTLIGGDTTRGPMSITVQITGSLSGEQAALTRAGAQEGDDIYVSGRLGDAALGLALIQGRENLNDPVLRACCVQRLNRPQPRVELGQALSGLATACIDVSDGLLADLGHILAASNCGAELDKAALPVNDWIRQQGRWELALQGGDDYELCFCAPEAERAGVQQQAESLGLAVTRIGRITAFGYKLIDNGQITTLDSQQGYQHFEP